MLKEKIDISSVYQNKSPNVSLNDNQNANNHEAGDRINNSWIVPISNNKSIIFPIHILISGSCVSTACLNNKQNFSFQLEQVKEHE